METSQTLAIESFSYSWLTNRPLRASLDASDDEETKYIMLRSKRFLEEAQNFNFHIPISESPLALVHADEIFSEGHILPKYGDRSNKEAFNASNSNTVLPISSMSSRNVCAVERINSCFLKKWRKTSKRILQRCLGFLRPLYWKASIRVDDLDRKVWEEVKSWNSSPQASSPPRGTALRKTKSWSNSPMASSPSYSAGDWSVDSSIYEAILHCKRSFEN